MYLSKPGILITGATGFVGKYVIRKLVSLSSCDIIVIVRNPAKLEKVLRKEYLKNLKIIQGDLLKYEDIKFIEKQLRILNPDIKIVINLVGGGPLTINYNIENEIMDLNFTTLKNLVKILINSNKLNNVKIFIHLSSLAAAGALNPEGRFHESMMCYPVLPYERAKYLGEVFLRKLATYYKQTKFIVLRLPQIYGLESKEFISLIKIIEKGIFPLVPNKVGTLPLIYVDEVADIIRYIADNYEIIYNKMHENFKIFMLCEGNYSYTNLVNMVRKTFGKGGYIPVPYELMYLAAFFIENVFKLLNKNEPFNTYRLKSFCKRRIVEDNFAVYFNYKYKYNLINFLMDIRNGQ